MGQLRRYGLVIEDLTISVTESGPARSPETVLIFSTSDDLATTLLTRLGRFTRTVWVRDAPPAVLAALSLTAVHLVLTTDDIDVDVLVDLLQRTITID